MQISTGFPNPFEYFIYKVMTMHEKVNVNIYSIENENSLFGNLTASFGICVESEIEF